MLWHLGDLADGSDPHRARAVACELRPFSPLKRQKVHVSTFCHPLLQISAQIRWVPDLRRLNALQPSAGNVRCQGATVRCLLPMPAPRARPCKDDGPLGECSAIASAPRVVWRNGVREAQPRSRIPPDADADPGAPRAVAPPRAPGAPRAVAPPPPPPQAPQKVSHLQARQIVARRWALGARSPASCVCIPRRRGVFMIEAMAAALARVRGRAPPLVSPHSSIRFLKLKAPRPTPHVCPLISVW